MTLRRTLIYIFRHYFRVFWDSFSVGLPRDIQSFRKDCEKLVCRYDTLLKEIADHMKTQSIIYQEHPEEFVPPLTLSGSDTFFLLSIKEDLANITQDCEQLLAKGIQHPVETQLHHEAMQLLLNQLQELRKYSDQIESALSDFEEKILQMEEEISNHTLCN